MAINENSNHQNDNRRLHTANAEKKNEFYTQLADIENELRHYRKHFENKVVLCNCDDPYESNFFKYFALNFNVLKLKKLICTSFDGSPVAYTQLSLFDDEDTPMLQEDFNKEAYKIEINEVSDYNNDGATDLSDVEWLLKNKRNSLTFLSEHGDFRSDECIEILKEADIVVTNPPFSLFREYVAQLFKYDKKFLIIGNQNAITYKEIYPLLESNKMWLGYGFPGNAGFFKSPYDDHATSSQHKDGLIRVSGIMWFTNLDIDKRHEPLILYRMYNPIDYPKYDNYDAINVDKTSDIPVDYNGVMGVPITFLEKYCPEQFSLVGMAAGNSRACHFYNDVKYLPNPNDRGGCCLLNGERKYSRLFIKKIA